MNQSLTQSAQDKRRRRLSAVAGVSWLLSLGGLALLLFGSTPDRVGPMGITLFFLLVFISLLAMGTLIRLRFKSGHSGAGQLLIVLLAAAVTSALAINTIELQIGDVILLGLFILTFSVYWTRLR